MFLNFLCIENENSTSVVVCALRCRRCKKAQNNEKIAAKYTQNTHKMCTNMHTKYALLIVLLTLYFYRRHRPRRCTAANFREVESKRERMFTMPEIWANNSVSVSEVCISEGGDVTMSSSTSSSCQQISATSDVYCLIDDADDT